MNMQRRIVVTGMEILFAALALLFVLMLMMSARGLES